MVSRPGLSRTPAPSRLVLSLASYIAVPLNPVSEEPRESVMTRLGSFCLSWAFNEGEKIAAVLAKATSDEVSKSSNDSVSRSASGRAMASPVMYKTFARSRPTILQTSSASKWGFA